MAKFRIKASDLAIDLGTANTLVYKKNFGLLVNEPTVVVLDQTNHELIKIGNEAKEMLGKTPEKYFALYPLENGIVSNFDFTEAILNHFFDKVNPGFSILQPKVVISIPSGVTDIQRRAVEDAALHAGCRDVILIEESLAACAGALKNVKSPEGKMIINIGAGTGEVAVISMGAIVCSKSIRSGGDDIDKNIINYIKKRYKVEIGKLTAEKIKNELCSLKVDKANNSMIVSGRDLRKAMPVSITVKSQEFISCFENYLEKLLDAIMIVLESTPPELSADIKKNGIVLTGGLSLLDGLREYIQNYINLKIIAVKNPELVTIKGCGYILENLEDFIN